jgi:hypothetical protein
MPFGPCRPERLNYDLVENLENGKDLSVFGWVRRGSAPILDQRGSHMLQKTSLTTPSTLPEKAVQNISGALLLLLSDVFALYLKTKNFHWHMSGPHFRDYHLMLDDQSDEIFVMTDAIAERARKIGGTTLRAIGQISRLQRIVAANCGSPF